MITSLRLEFFKLARKPRSYIGPSAMAGLIGIVLVAMKYGDDFRHIEERLETEFILTGSIVNAAFMTRFMLLEFVVYMLLPLFVCTVFGDLLASEAADGTVRTMLCRPVTRLRVAASKYLVGAVYAVALTLGAGLFAYLVGMVFLGRGSLVSMSDDGLWILRERVALVRLLQAYLLVAAGMVAVGSISFAISAFLSNSNGAIAGAMGVVIVSGIVGSIQYFEKLKPYLLTTYLNVGQFIVDKPDVQSYMKSLGIAGVYALVSLVVALIAFQRRDVLS